MIPKIISLTLFIVCAALAPRELCAASAPLSLANAENSAVNFSPRIKSLLSEQKSYEDRALAQRSMYYPRLTLDGSYKYVTTVQEISLPIPGSAPMKFGDNSNYSLGPSLNWTAWDYGNTKNSYNSASAAAEAKELEAEAARIQVIFAARSAYFQVALANEQAALYSDALKLAEAQYEDIKLNAKAGTKSRADELKAHQEVLSRMKLLRQAGSDVASAMRELSALTGNDLSEASLESVDSLLAKFEKFAGSSFNPDNPAINALNSYSRSAQYSGLAAGAGQWPKLQISARSSLEYPNLNKLESYNQNSLGAALSWAFFESGASKNRANENKELSETYNDRGKQLESDMRRDWDKAVERLSSLRDQQKINDISVSETGELAEITYKTFKNGAVSFIEVENANFKALEAKIDSARTKVQMLINLAALASMAK